MVIVNVLLPLPGLTPDGTVNHDASEVTVQFVFEEIVISLVPPEAGTEVVLLIVAVSVGSGAAPSCMILIV